MEFKAGIRWSILLIGSLLTACVSVRVESLTDQVYPPRDETASIQSLSVEPARPHIDLAMITVSSANAGIDTLRQKIADRARKLGADAVIFGPIGVLATMLPSPYYEPGLFGPSGAAFGLYGYGWYTPYASNPYLFTQGAVDQPRLDLFLSGVAIRYVQHTGYELTP